MTKHSSIDPAKMHTWGAFVPVGDLWRRVPDVKARTRSEARARIKAGLGIGRKGRLPVGTDMAMVAF